jgi:hypothetical protein
MSKRRTRPVRVRTFHPDDQELLLEETILEWQALGPSAAWNAIYDILGWWFAARGLDPEAQRVDRTHLEVHPVPWVTSEPTAETGPVASPQINFEDLLTARLPAGRSQDLLDAAEAKKALELERRQQQAQREKPGVPQPKPARSRQRRDTPGSNSDRGGEGPESER